MKFDTKKTIAALAMSATLVATPVTALAAGAAGVTESNAGSAPVVSKTWADGLPLATENVPFTLKYQGYEEYVPGVTTGTAYNGDTAMSSGDEVTVQLPIGDDGLNALQVFAGITFDAPGDYVFTLQEVQNANVHYQADTAEYQVKVRVVWGTGEGGVTTDEPVVDSVGVYTTDDQKVNGAGSFTNTAVDRAAFSLTKVLAGNNANLDDTFDFVVTFSGLQPGASYSYTGAQSGTMTAGADGTGTLEVTLGNNQTVSFANLPDKAMYTVSEGGKELVNEADAVTVNGYEATMKGADGELATGDSDAVVVTNAKNAATITGLAVTVLPYIGGLAVAGAGVGAIVVSRRHKHDDQF